MRPDISEESREPAAIAYRARMLSAASLMRIRFDWSDAREEEEELKALIQRVTYQSEPEDLRRLADVVESMAAQLETDWAF